VLEEVVELVRVGLVEEGLGRLAWCQWFHSSWHFVNRRQCFVGE